jgi:exosome complex RNA-binding protein Csl4
MKASEYIKEIQNLIDIHGDLEITTQRIDCSVIIARSPVVRHRLILKGRESKCRYFGYEDESRKGEKVIGV